MPVTKHPLAPTPAAHLRLVRRLAAELAADAPASPAAPNAPDIEEYEQRGNYLQVQVTWDDRDWAKLNPEARGRVIMDAYEAARPIEDVLRITVALGLTHAEAERLRVSARSG